MTTDIKELVTLIRLNADMRLWPAADALEALAGEVRGLNIVLKGWINGFNKQEMRAMDAEAERDRLKAALECVRQYVKGGPDHVSDEDITNIFRVVDSALRAAGDGR